MRRSDAVVSAPRSLRRQLLLHLSAPLLAVLVFGAFGGMIIARHVGYQVHDQWLLDSAMTLKAQVRLVDGHARLALPQVAIDMFRWDRVDRIYWQASTARQGVLLANASIAPPPPVRLDKPVFFDAVIDGAPVRVVAVEVALASAPADTLRIMVAETMHKREALAGKIVAQSAPCKRPCCSLPACSCGWPSAATCASSTAWPPSWAATTRAA